MDKSDFLWIVWTDRKDNTKYGIGKLIKDQNKYYFEYNKEELKKAKDNGFNGIFCFPIENMSYESDNMFPAFSTRLPSRNREDILEILEKYELKEYDAYELLKKTKGKVMNDNLEFLTQEVYKRVKAHKNNSCREKF